MKIFRNIWDAITEGLGCLGSIGAIILPSLLIVGAIAFFTSRCGDKHSNHLSKEELQAYRDSIERVERERQLVFEREYQEHLESFYNTFNKYYPVFSSSDELGEWLLNANHAAFELLYLLYSKHNHNYDGENGLDSLANYLFWGPPGYHSYCDQCGAEVFFSDDE